MSKSPKKPVRRASTVKDPNRYPPGLNRAKASAIIAHYEGKTEDQAVAEDEAAYHSPKVTMMGVPIELVPAVQKLIARKSG